MIRAPVFSLAFLTIPDIGPVEAVNVAAKSGYEMVGLRMLPATPDEPPHPLLTDNALLHDVVLALADTGIRVGDMELIRLKPETDIGYFCTFFERAQILNARHVIVVGDDPDNARLIDHFARLAELAAPYNLTMNLEPMPWTQIKNLEEATDIVRCSGQENTGVLIDSLHFYRHENSLEQLENTPRELINIFQICDASSAFDPAPESIRQLARTARLLPGKGDLDLQSLISRIPESAIVSIEVPNNTLIQQLSPIERGKLALEATREVYAKSVPGKIEC